MKEYKFRGKRIDNGEWVYGVPLFYGDGIFISTGELKNNNGADWRIKAFEVDPETVGQYTEHLDSNKKEIYSKDIVEANIYSDEVPQILDVYYNDFMTAFVIDYVDSDSEVVPIGFFAGSLRIIGNSIENPELLEK